MTMAMVCAVTIVIVIAIVVVAITPLLNEKYRSERVTKVRLKDCSFFPKIKLNQFKFLLRKLGKIGFFSS